MSESRRLVEPQSHEFDANLNYNDSGLNPYFALAGRVADGGGSVETTATFDSEQWDVKLSYQDGNLLPPDGNRTPAGAEWNVGTSDGGVREFRLKAEANDGGNADKSATFHVRPRWQNQEAENKYGRVVELPIPDSLANQHTDAVSIRAQGSNLSFEKYEPLLRTAARAVGVTGYFRDLHQTSNIQDAARYLRVNKNASGPIHARTGPITQLAHVLQNDREGYRKLVQNDDDDHGNNLPGYYHTVTLGPRRVREVMPSHELPVEVKHYYSREAKNRDPDDPLAHPKLEVSYQRSKWDGSLGADDDALEQLADELDSWIYTVIQESLGEPALRADGGPYVEDEYFTAENAHTAATPVRLNITQIRHEEESVVYKHFADGMPDTDRSILKTLVADGGQISPAELADETGRHRETVYDALDRMDYLVEHGYGDVQLQSTYVAELVADAIEQAENAVGRAMNAAGKALTAAERGLDEKTSAYLAWQEKYTDNFDDHDSDDGVNLDLGQVEDKQEVRRILREGYQLWKDMNKDQVRYRMGHVTWRIADELGETSSGIWNCRIWDMMQSTSKGGTKVITDR